MKVIIIVIGIILFFIFLDRSAKKKALERKKQALAPLADAIYKKVCEHCRENNCELKDIFTISVGRYSMFVIAKSKSTSVDYEKLGYRIESRTYEDENLKEHLLNQLVVERLGPDFALISNTRYDSYQDKDTVISTSNEDGTVTSQYRTVHFKTTENKIVKREEYDRIMQERERQKNIKSV